MTHSHCRDEVATNSRTCVLFCFLGYLSNLCYFSEIQCSKRCFFYFKKLYQVVPHNCANNS